MRLTSCFLFLLFAFSVNAGELKVFTVKALKPSLQEISRFAEGKQPGVKIQLQIAKSGELGHMLERGVPGDVFVLNEEDFSSLKGKNVLDEKSVLRLLSNEVVVVTGDKSELTVKEPKDLLKEEIKKVAIYKEKSPAGEKIKAYLTKAGVWDALYAKKLDVADAKAAFDMITGNQAQVMFSVSSEAARKSGIRILWRFPAAEVPGNVYVVGISAGSVEKELSQRYLETLLSTISRKIFENAGYRVLIP